MKIDVSKDVVTLAALVLPHILCDAVVVVIYPLEGSAESTADNYNNVFLKKRDKISFVNSSHLSSR